MCAKLNPREIFDFEGARRKFSKNKVRGGREVHFQHLCYQWGTAIYRGLGYHPIMPSKKWCWYPRVLRILGGDPRPSAVVHYLNFGKI